MLLLLLLLLLLLVVDLWRVAEGAGGLRTRVLRTSNRRISILLSRSVRRLEARKMPRSCSLVFLLKLTTLFERERVVRSKLLSSSSWNSGSGVRVVGCDSLCDAAGEDESNPPASCNEIWVSCRSSIGPRTPVGGAALRSRLLGREPRRT